MDKNETGSIRIFSFQVRIKIIPIFYMTVFRRQLYAVNYHIQVNIPAKHRNFLSQKIDCLPGQQ